MKEKKVNDRTLFFCEVCGFGYLDKETAQKCEKWCTETGTCSLELTAKAVYFPNPFETKPSQPSAKDAKPEKRGTVSKPKEVFALLFCLSLEAAHAR